MNAIDPTGPKKEALIFPMIRHGASRRLREEIFHTIPRVATHPRSRLPRVRFQPAEVIALEISWRITSWLKQGGVVQRESSNTDAPGQPAAPFRERLRPVPQEALASAWPSVRSSAHCLDRKWKEVVGPW